MRNYLVIRTLVIVHLTDFLKRGLFLIPRWPWAFHRYVRAIVICSDVVIIRMVDYQWRHQKCNYFSHFLIGFCASTLTNPIWLIKTRLQLDRASGQKILSIRSCIANIHQDLVSYTKVVKRIENWLFWRIFFTFFFREFEVFGKVLQPRIGELVKLWFTLWYMNIWRNSWLWCRIRGKMMKKPRLILHVSCFVELVLKPVLPLLHTLMVSQFMIFYAFYVSLKSELLSNAQNHEILVDAPWLFRYISSFESNL